MVQEIHHLPTRCQMTCLDRDVPNTLQTQPANRTNASNPIQTRAETRREPDLPLALSPHPNWPPSSHSVPGISKVKLIFAPSLEGLWQGTRLGWQQEPPHSSHRMEERGKAELRNPRQGDSVSSKARNVKPAPQHCST